MRDLFIYFSKYLKYFLILSSWHWLSCLRLLVPLFHDKNPDISLEFDPLEMTKKANRSTTISTSTAKYFGKGITPPGDYEPDEKLEDLLTKQLGLYLRNATVFNRYTKTLMVTLRIMLQSGYEFEELVDTTYTMLMTTFVMFAGWIYLAHIFIVLMNVIMSSESSETKFEMICREIRAFCRSSSLSSELTDRIQNYVKLKYQNHYFNEQKIQSSIPVALRKEIMMNSCSHFLSKVSIFKNLPLIILEQIVMCLEFEIFFPGDVIMTADSVGDCMYFISFGTAQIITSTGVIYDRLYDGDYFGEIALLTRGARRTATVKAEEVCETYKLSRKDFRKVVEPHPEVLRHFEQIALQRIRNNSRQQRVSFQI